MRNVRGFTLIELMVTLVVAAILLALAVPSFTAMIKKNRASSDVSALTTAIAYARSEAVARNKDICVTVPSAQGTWKDGWLVRIEDGSCAGDQLRVFAPASSTSVLTVKASGSAVTKFGFTSSGFRSGSAAYVISYFAGSACDPETGRVLTINATGRVSIAACTVGP